MEDDLDLTRAEVFELLETGESVTIAAPPWVESSTDWRINWVNDSDVTNPQSDRGCGMLTTMELVGGLTVLVLAVLGLLMILGRTGRG